LAIWDANDWWHVGRQGDAQGRPWGFVDNPDTPGTSTAEIHAMFAATDNAIANEDQPVLIVGGDFDLIVGYDPFGNPIILKNLAAWVFDPMDGRYVWPTIGDADAPVRAFTMFDPGSFTVPVPGDGEDRMFEDTAPNLLIIGGDFTNIGGAAANRLASFSFTTGLQQVGDGIAN